MQPLFRETLWSLSGTSIALASYRGIVGEPKGLRKVSKTAERVNLRQHTIVQKLSKQKLTIQPSSEDDCPPTRSSVHHHSDWSSRYTVALADNNQAGMLRRSAYHSLHNEDLHLVRSMLNILPQLCRRTCWVYPWE